MGMAHGVRTRVHAARASRARQVAVLATLVGALLLAGCATGGSGQQTLGGWADRALGRTSAEGAPQISYAAVGGVKMFSEPDAGSSVMGVLTRHEELRRYQSESGFAYVQAAGNLSGWVPESQLVERRPAPRRAAEVPSEPVPSQSLEQPTSDDTATETVPQEPDAEPAEPERSIFDPY